MRRMNETLKAVDLFCGAGGASLGLHDAGLDVVGFDYWDAAVLTHNTNGLLAHVHDLSDSTLDHLIPECDVMWCSPPCQSFSAAGLQRGADDKRNGFPWALRIVAARMPRLVVFENVKGLTFKKNVPYLESILAKLRDLGYDVAWKVLNCADFGVPQTRQRCFIVGRLDGAATMPQPTHAKNDAALLPWVTMAAALGWGTPSIPYPTVATGHCDSQGLGGSAARQLMRQESQSESWVHHPIEVAYRKGVGIVERHGERRNIDATIEPMRTIHATIEKNTVVLNYRQNAQGDASSPIRKDVTATPSPTVTTQAQNQWVLDRLSTTVCDDVRILQPGRHDPTIPGSQGAGAFKLTIEELGILQGFPDDFEWVGNKTQRSLQVGNAVPPIMAQAIVQANL